MRRSLLIAFVLSLLASAAHAAVEAVPGVLLVRWRPAVRMAERASMRQELGARRDREFAAISVERLIVANGSTEQALLRLAQDPRVEFAEPDYLVRLERTPDDPRFAEQWALQNTGQTGGTPGADVRGPRGWDIATDASSVIVGVVDTGSDLTHPDLASNLWVNEGEIAGNGIDDDGNGYIDDVHGYDFINDDADPSDDHGHGSHVAGIIAARGDNASGVTGVAWRGRIMSLKFLGSTGSGPMSDAIEAILYATRMGARIVNHSWGGTGYSQALLLAFRASGQAGVTSVVAAGNSGVDLEVQPAFPAAFLDPAMVKVAATDAFDRLADFSNHGAVSVEIGAPGTAILSLAPSGQYAVLSGTSMASPLVAGALALLLAKEPALDPIALRQRLLASALPLASLQGRTVSGGRLDLVRLLSTPEDEPPGAIADFALAQVGSHAAWLTWTATGDDGAIGSADRYLLRIATGPVDSVAFEDMTPVPAPDPLPSGSLERVRIGGLASETHYWVALRAMDDQGSAGPRTVPVEFTTQPPPRAQLDRVLVESDLAAGESERHVVLLSNPSPGTLEWSFLNPRLTTTGAGPVAAGGYEVAGLGQGAPTRFGWVTRGSGASTVALEGDEGISAPLALPFAFPYFGGEYRSLRISSNGFLTFLGEDPAPQPTALPSPLAPRATIAPFWADLDPGPSIRRVWMQSDPLRVVITWQETRLFGDAEPLTFQVWLMRTGEVRFQYLALSGRGAFATAGLQGAAASLGLTVAARESSLRDSLAVRLLPPRAWAKAAPAGGVLGPGEDVLITVDLETRGLPGGLQSGVLDLVSDSPIEPSLVLEARLMARAAPHVVASHTWLDFGVSPNRRDSERSLGVANEGALPARVHSISVMGAAFEAPEESFDLAPGEARSLTVSFRPTRVGEQRAILSIASDDPQYPRQDVVLAGEGREPGAFVLSQVTLHAAAATGLRAGAERDEHRVALSNPGGMPIAWRLAAIAEARPQEGVVGLGGRSPSAGGPDPAGYRWRSSDEPGAPPFLWESIQHTGVRLFGGADDSVHTGLLLPFEFPFYGRKFSGVSVCTNGWLSFESTAPLRQGVPLPDPAAPLGLIAPFWTDLDARLSGGDGAIHAKADGNRFIVEWTDVRRFGMSERFAFQVWLWSDGRIDFVYRRMDGARTGATIGLQDADGRVGLTMAHGAALARDSLRLSIRPTPNWLTATHYEGVLAPRSTDTLGVSFAVEGLVSGRWAGELRFESASLDPGAWSVPCTLQAGERSFVASVTPRSWRAASEQPFVELEFELPEPQPGAWWLDDEEITPSRSQELPGGRRRYFVESDRLLPRLASGDRTRELVIRDVRSGWQVARQPIEVESLLFEVAGLPGEDAPSPPDRVLGEPGILHWPPFSGMTSVSAWLRVGPGQWESVATSAGVEIAIEWPRPLEDARLELVATSGDSVVGVWRSSRFAIRGASGPLVPERLAWSVRGANPSFAPVTLELALPSRADVRAEVFDTRGARVRELARGPFEAGLHALVWDGRGSQGAAVAPGVYLVRARTSLGDITRRIVFLGRP